jgi:hypothetical protein
MSVASSHTFGRNFVNFKSYQASINATAKLDPVSARAGIDLTSASTIFPPFPCTTPAGSGGGFLKSNLKSESSRSAMRVIWSGLARNLAISS